MYYWAQLYDGRLAINPGFFFLFSKAFSRIIFSVIFKASNNQLVENKIEFELIFKLPYLNSNLALTLGYLDPALNNSNLVINVQDIHCNNTFTVLSAEQETTLLSSGENMQVNTS